MIRYLKQRLDSTGLQPMLFDMDVAHLRAQQLVLITTRYDDMLEKAFRVAEKPVDVVVNNVDVTLRHSDRVTLVKLYGDVRQPESLTLTEEMFDALEADKPSIVKLTRQVFGKTLLLMGYDLDTRNFHSLRSEIRRELNEYAPLTYAVSTRRLTAENQLLWRDRQIYVLDDDAQAVIHSLTVELMA